MLDHARMRGSWLLVLALGACATDDFVDDPGDGTWEGGKADGASAANVEATHLDIHLADHTAVATIRLERAGSVALEAGGLAITRVSDERGKRHYRVVDGKLLVVRYSGGADVMALSRDANGNITKAESNISGLTGFINPLDLTEDVSTGNLYIADYGGQAIWLARPIAPGAKASADKTTLTFNDDYGSNNTTPRRISSCDMQRLRVDCLTPSASAARRKLP